MTQLVVIVDDEREFDVRWPEHFQVIYLRTLRDALAWFAEWWTTNQNVPVTADQTAIRFIDQLWLDHDLGSEGSDTQDVITLVSFLWNLSLNTGALPIYSTMVHSQNPVGASNIMNFVSQMNINAAQIPPPV